MPTIIDSLIVEVGLDPKKYTEGRKQVSADQKAVRDEAVRTGKELEARGSQAAQFFGKIRGQALALFTTLTAGRGLAKFTQDMLRSDAATGRLAKSLGIATADLGAWQRVAERTGGTAEGITSALASLTDTFEQIKLTGTAANAPYLQALGLKREDLEDAQGALLKISDAFSKMDPRRARVFGAALGFDQETVNLLMRGRPAVEAMLRAEKERGGVTDESAKATEEANRQLADLKHNFDQAGREILVKFLPEATKFLEWLNAVLDKSPDLAKAIWGVTAAVSALAGIKLSAGLLSLLGLGGRVAALEGAGAAAKSARAGGILRAGASLLSKINPFVAGIAMALTPTEANKGEDELVRAANARWEAKKRREREAAGNYTSRDLAIRTLIKEAKAGSAVGQGDVAHVILNRAAASGKTPGQVVQERMQFQPWNTAPGRAALMSIDPNSKAYRDAAAAWDKAVAEQARGIDPTKGATHYFSPKGMVANVRDGLAKELVPKWAREGTPTIAREGHLFYKGLGYRGIAEASSHYGSDVRTGAKAAVASSAANPTTNTTNIGTINVQTRATDAQGIARELPGAIRRSSNLATQANSGAQ